MAKLNIEPRLYTFLAANDSIVSLAGGRVYPFGETPQKTPFPYVTFQRIDSERWRTLSGPSGVSYPRMQIDVFALSYRVACVIGEAIQNQIDDFFRGMMSDIGVQSAQSVDVRDSIEEPENADESTVFRRSIDAIFYHEE